MARTPALRIAPRRTALAGGLIALIAVAALLLPGAALAGASPGIGNFFLVTPWASVPSQVPCGTVTEFTTPHGYQFPVQESPGILSALRLPGPQAQTFLTDFRLLGTFLSWLTVTTSSCGSGGSSGSGVVAE